MSPTLCRKNVKKYFGEIGKYDKFQLEFIDRGKEILFTHGSFYWKSEKILGLLWNCNKRGNKLLERANFSILQ